jgi:hypothetical protein
MKRYYKKHKKIINARTKRWRKAHRGAVSGYNRKYNRKDKE